MAEATDLTTDLKKMNNESLIDLGGSVDTEIKRLTRKLKAIKAEADSRIGKNKAGTYNSPGVQFDAQVVVEVGYKDIDPVKAYHKLEEIQKQACFVDVVKVALEPLKKVLGEDVIKKLRVRKPGFTHKVSFKKRKE